MRQEEAGTSSVSRLSLGWKKAKGWQFGGERSIEETIL